MQTKSAHTKYREVRRNFHRLKVIAYDINDVLSRYLRVSPMRPKSPEETARTFRKKNQKQKPQKVWTDKGTDFKGSFNILCDQEGIDTYTTQSQTKSAYAERNIRLLKNIFFEHLEHKWFYLYINKLSQIVDTINSPVNRVTKLAPNKVSKKHVPLLRSLAAEKSAKLVKKTSIASWRQFG